MKFLRKIGLGVLLLGVLAGLWGCDVAKIKDLSVTSVGVKYLVPTSSRSMDAVLLLGLDNPGNRPLHGRRAAGPGTECASV